jgi:hypothetical protein
MSGVVYRSEVRIERVKGPVRDDTQTDQTSQKRFARVEYSFPTPGLEGKSFPTTRCSVVVLS